MTYLKRDTYNIYDSLPCAAVVFKRSNVADIVYINTAYTDLFGNKCVIPDKIVDTSFYDVLNSADEPQSVCFSCTDINDKCMNVRALIVNMSKEAALALLVDNTETQELKKRCKRYADFISGINESFFEYNRLTDTLIVLMPSVSGSIESKTVCNYMSDLKNDTFVFDEDKPIIKNLEKIPPTEEIKFNIRMRLDKNGFFEWFRIIIRPSVNSNLITGSIRNINDIKAEQEKLMEKVSVDPLSKVYNRSVAIEKIEKRLAECDSDSKAALIVLDIDNFKKINDTFGHMYGDAVIAMSAGSIKNTLDDNDIIGRFGGDEFFIYCDNVQSDILEKKLENIRLAMLKMRLDRNDNDDISCSMGVAVGGGNSKYEELFKQADSALYAAKKNGKNRFEYFDGTYFSEEALSYANVKDEYESNEAHNVTSMALEIASKSPNAENAVINIIRHIGMALELDAIQIMEFDAIEDKVELKFQWWREINGEYNVVMAEKRTGYYNHNDIVLFRNRFAKDKIFEHTIDFETGFSQKYCDVFKAMHDRKYIHCSNAENEDVFYAVTFQSFNTDRKWTKQEFSDMMSITKILSMYLKSSYVETEREKMLIHRLDYTLAGLYTLGKFYDESGRMTRAARAENGRMGMIHFDIKDLFGINTLHSWELGNELIDNFAKLLITVDKSRAIAAGYSGTDMMIMLFHTTMADDDVIKEVEQGMENFCAAYSEYKNPPIIIKAGISIFNPGQNIGFQIDKAKRAKKGKDPDRCRCYMYED